MTFDESMQFLDDALGDVDAARRAATRTRWHEAKDCALKTIRTQVGLLQKTLQEMQARAQKTETALREAQTEATVREAELTKLRAATTEASAGKVETNG